MLSFLMALDHLSMINDFANCGWLTTSAAAGDTQFKVIVLPGKH